MQKSLSIFSLTLITICSVDSIRNLPAAAMAGNQLINYFILALLFFLFPCAIISIWFSNQSDQGVYGWVKKGLGKKWSFMAIWFQCVQNVIIYPTMLSFIAGTLLYCISPELVDNKPLIFLIITSLIWGLTWVNLKGIQLSSRFNTFCSITGLLIPFLVILLMGLYWYLTEAPASTAGTLPQATPYSWTSLTAIILSFCGIELAAVHTAESKPGAFPKAVAISLVVIFFSMLFGSMTIAMIIPAQQLSFISSIPQLVQLFFTKMHCEYLAIVVNGLIAVGCIGASNNWLIAPIKGLGFAANEGFLDKRLTKLNENKAPATLLILQAICVTIVSSLFLIIPAINSSYWILLNAATQINLLMYLLLFLSALKIALSMKKSFNIVGICCLGLLGVGISLIVSFTPPPSLQLSSQLTYALGGCVFLLITILIPLRNRNQLV